MKSNKTKNGSRFKNIQQNWVGEFDYNEVDIYSNLEEEYEQRVENIKSLRSVKF